MKSDYLIEILKTELSKKRARNGAYSLRSYARDLGIDPSNLSKILNEKKTIGKNLRRNLTKKLGFDDHEFENWSDKKYTKHSLEVFQIVSEQQHYAILELFKLKGFSGTPKEISHLLDIDISKARESLMRLRETGLLKRHANTRKWMPSEDSSSSILSVATSKAHRDQQKQILEGAISALSDIPIEWRSQSSITVAIDTYKLDEAKQLIKKFRREIASLLTSSENRNEVYQLSISLYPVTKRRTP